MMQGDQYSIQVELFFENGTPVTKDDIRELEISVGKLRKTLSDNDIDFDRSTNRFNVHIVQQETFSLIGLVKVQARILFLSGDVVGVDLGTVSFENAISKEVLK